MANEISLDITETVTKVEVTEDVTSINITPSVTTVELKGISIARGFSATSTTYDGSSNTLGYGTSVSAALDHINTKGVSINKTNTMEYGHKIDFTGAGEGQTVYDAMNLRNNNIIGVNNIRINDAGDHEGVEWPNWKIFESPNPFDGEGVDGNQEGNFQIAYENGFNGWETRLEVKPEGIDVTGTITFDGGTTSADLNFGDSDKAVFGAGDDLQVYHDGSNSYVQDVGDGDLNIQGSNLNLKTGGGTESFLTAVGNGAVTLFYNNSSRLATTANGVAVTGDLAVDTDTLYVDSTNNEVGISTTNPQSKLDVVGTGGPTSGFSFRNSHDIVRGYFGSDNDNADFLFTYIGTNSAEVKLKHNGNVILCESGGNVGINKPGPQTALDVAGTITATSADINGAITAGGDITLDGWPKSDYELKGDVDGSIRFDAIANEDLSKGDVVYIVTHGSQGSETRVAKAQANSSSTMPAFGLALNDVTSGNAIQVVTFGNLYGQGDGANRLDTSDYDSGTTLYVSADTAGVWTDTPPSGEGNLIQNIGKVVRKQQNNGVIKVGGAGRTNATGNLNNGNIFIGNASNQAVTASFDTTFASSFATRFIDEDDMSSNSATKAPSQQSVKAYVDAEVAGIVDSAPAALDTLNELAEALGDDANFSTTVTDSIGTKLAKASNLSDLADAGTARTNLGLGTAATTASTEYATAAQGTTADSALQPGDVVNNLTSTSINTPLSAAQGKALEDGKQDNLTFGIADDNAVEIDGAATNGKMAKFTANGITSTSTISIGTNWTIEESGTDLLFKYSENEKARLSNTGVLGIVSTEALDNVAPVITSANSVSVAENTAAGTDILALTATDSGPGSDGTVTFSTTHASFSVDSNNNLEIDISPDYETQNSYTVPVVATDSAGNTTTQNIAVTITDVAESDYDSTFYLRTGSVGDSFTGYGFIDKTDEDNDGGQLSTDPSFTSNTQGQNDTRTGKTAKVFDGKVLQCYYNSNGTFVFGLQYRPNYGFTAVPDENLTITFTKGVSSVDGSGGTAAGSLVTGNPGYGASYTGSANVQWTWNSSDVSSTVSDAFNNSTGDLFKVVVEET